MKKTFATIAVLAVISLALFGFKSETVFHGQQDREYTAMVAGDTVISGQVVSIGLEYDADMTLNEYDTGTWVILSGAQNDSYAIGISMEDAYPGTLIRICTRGRVPCRIDGSDSAGAGIYAGYVLSTADRSGFLGATFSDSEVNGALDSVRWNCGLPQEIVTFTNPVGWALEAVATTDTGALTTYDCYVDFRSRF